MDDRTSDIKDLKTALSHLRNHNSGSPLISLVEAQINIQAGAYHKAKKNLEALFRTPNIEAAVLFSGLKVISLLKNEMGLNVILRGVREDLWKIVVANIELNWHAHVLAHIGFSKNSDPSNLQSLARHLVSYFANNAYKHDLYDLAFFFETEIYENYVTRFETNDAFDYGMSLTTEAAESAGYRLGESLGPIKLNFQNEKPVIGFFFHNASMLAHIFNIYQYLKSASVKGFKDFTPILFCLGGRNREFEIRFKEIGVDIVYLDVDNNGEFLAPISHRLKHMRKICQELQVDKLIWGCLAINMAFAFSMRFAKEQIWWSQKWKKFHFSAVDKYIWSYGMCDEQIFYGRKWLTSWFQNDAWNVNADISDVSKIRGRFLGKVILGTLSRAAKMSNPQYMKTICKILKQHDDVVFFMDWKKSRSSCD